jgi:hypothetical protein
VPYLSRYISSSSSYHLRLWGVIAALSPLFMGCHLIALFLFFNGPLGNGISERYVFAICTSRRVVVFDVRAPHNTRN